MAFTFGISAKTQFSPENMSAIMMKNFGIFEYTQTTCQSVLKSDINILISDEFSSRWLFELLLLHLNYMPVIL